MHLATVHRCTHACAADLHPNDDDVSTKQCLDRAIERRASTVFGKIKFQILSVRLQSETRVLVLQSRLVSSARLFHLLIAGQKVGADQRRPVTSRRADVTRD